MMTEGTEQTTTAAESTTETPTVVVDTPVVESAPNGKEKDSKPKSKAPVKEEPENLSREKKIHQARRDFFIIDEEHNRTKQPKLIDEYARTIPEVGVEKPLLVKVITDESGVKRGLVFDGVHRLLAFDKAVDEGMDPSTFWIPYTNDQTLNDEQRDIIQLRRNTNANMLPFDEALACDRLIKRGWSREEIAKHSGKTTSHIAQILPLVSAPKKAQKYLTDGRITGTLLLSLMKIHVLPNTKETDWDSLIQIFENIISTKEATNATGKKANKITAKDVEKVVTAEKPKSKISKKVTKIIDDIKLAECETDEQKVAVKGQVKMLERAQKFIDLVDDDPQKALNYLMKNFTLIK